MGTFKVAQVRPKQKKCKLCNDKSQKSVEWIFVNIVNFFKFLYFKMVFVIIRLFVIDLT